MLKSPPLFGHTSDSPMLRALCLHREDQQKQQQPKEGDSKQEDTPKEQNQQQQQQSDGHVTIAAPTILTTTQFHDDSFSDHQSIQLRVQDEKTNQPSVNIPLLKAVSTAVWKLSASPEACDRFRQLGVVHIFIRQLNQSTEEVHPI